MQENIELTYERDGAVYRFVRSNGHVADFVSLCHQLDYELDLRAGDDAQRARHSKYNTLDEIRHAFVIYHGEKAVGCGAIRRFDEKTVELKRIYIAMDERRKGLASELIGHLQDWARELGYQRMILETPESMLEAQQLYCSLAFEKIVQYGPYKEMPEARCMSKSLRSE